MGILKTATVENPSSGSIVLNSYGFEVEIPGNAIGGDAVTIKIPVGRFAALQAKLEADYPFLVVTPGATEAAVDTPRDPAVLDMSSRELCREWGGEAIQGFAPDPTKSSNDTINAGATKTVDTTGWLVIKFYAPSELQVFLNANTAYMRHPEGGTVVLRGEVTSVKFKNAGGVAVAIDIEGM